MDKIQIDIQKRTYDSKYVIWEQKWPYVALGYTDRHEKFYSNLTAEDHKWVENDSLAKHWYKMWIPVVILKDKAAAVKYCRTWFGRHCFKENDGVAIAFT